MKKILAFLMACMLLMSIAPAFAYEAYQPVKPSGNYGLQHTLVLTDDGRTDIPADITYNFTVVGPFVENPVIPNDGNAAAKIAMMVTGKPSIASITYDADEPLPEGTSTQPLEINWNDVAITEPGVYYWNVTKEVVYNAPAGTTNEVPTNLRASNRLYVVATINETTNVLEIANVRLIEDIENPQDQNKDSITDQFPATTVDLALSKQVTGTQGSKNQYFQFTLQVTPLAGIGERTYTIKDANESIPLTPYNDEIKEATTSFTATGGTTATVVLWLKHGQTVTILDLPYGSDVTMTETVPEGYTAATQVNNESKQNDKSEVTIDNLNADTTVTFTNHKDAQVPTGIDLQTGAPIMGLLAAAALMVLLFVGKRKEAAE